MKNTKKLFLSVFALSAMILSACSGGTVTPDTSSTEPAPGTSSTEPAPVPASSSSLAPEESSSLNPEESSSGSEESSSGGGEESSSSEQVEFKADYQIEIGNAKYDLILNEGQHYTRKNIILARMFLRLSRQVKSLRLKNIKTTSINHSRLLQVLMMNQDLLITTS